MQKQLIFKFSEISLILDFTVSLDKGILFSFSAALLPRTYLAQARIEGLIRVSPSV